MFSSLYKKADDYGAEDPFGLDRGRSPGCAPPSEDPQAM